ncbi:MAG: enoyl-CoA hydratase-related protein [Eubacteriales bacterium]|nr:enoyl-CoA hydratase-related protein [Eubacteriales bacterium]
MGNIRVEIRENVGILTITRPKQLNALNREVLRELGQALDRVKEDDRIRCLIITGEGKAFVAGADISEMAGMDKAQAHEFAVLGHTVFKKIETLPAPVIAAVNGYALGGGCELALCCDIIIASENAVFAQPEVGIGIIPGFGGTQRLGLRIGIGRVKRMVLTGERIKAPEAYAIGLADGLVQPEKLIEDTVALAKTIAAHPKNAVAAAKKAVQSSYSKRLNEGLKHETSVFERCFSTDEPKQAMRSFLKKN